MKALVDLMIKALHTAFWLIVSICFTAVVLFFVAALVIGYWSIAVYVGSWAVSILRGVL